jgi:DNA-binding transcriptional MerR regulator
MHPSPPDAEPFVRPEVAAVHANVSVDTIRRWRRQGLVAGWVRARRLFVSFADIERVRAARALLKISA